jgi:hypothetical protein
MSSVEIAILRRAREIISDPEKWTQGTYARDGYEAPIDPGDGLACCWCALGAIAKAAIEMNAQPGDGSAAVDKLQVLAGSPVCSLNDHGPRFEAHAAVLSLFDKALAQEAA